MSDPETCLPDDLIQASAKLQRSLGEASVAFDCSETGHSRLTDLHQSGSAKIRLPKMHGSTTGEAVIINTSGGLTDGDRLSMAVAAGERSNVIVTSQACEKIYRAASNDPAEVRNSVRVGPSASLIWLPQETIFYNGGRLDRALEVDLAEDAHFIGLEAMILGRQAMGESVGTGSLVDRWSIRRSGQQIFADALKLDGDIADLIARPALLAGHCALATLVQCGEKAGQKIEPLRQALGESGGASYFNNIMVARLVANSGADLRRLLIKALSILMAPLPLPRIWTM